MNAGLPRGWKYFAARGLYTFPVLVGMKTAGKLTSSIEMI